MMSDIMNEWFSKLARFGRTRTSLSLHAVLVRIIEKTKRSLIRIGFWDT